MSLTSYRAAPPRGGVWVWRGEPGGDLLFRALRRSTIGAEGFHGRVRDGIGCFAPRYGHQAFRRAGIGDRAGNPAVGTRPAAPVSETACLGRKRVVRVSCGEGVCRLSA